ncbi:hypothetical protein MMC22_004009 [Lobaria immixta]|nr:hypothetical protein [Lobaria immixta]
MYCTTPPIGKLCGYPDPLIVTLLSNYRGALAINLDRPASTNQLRLTLKRLSLVANVLTLVYIHNLPYSAAQDLAYEFVNTATSAPKKITKPFDGGVDAAAVAAAAASRAAEVASRAMCCQQEQEKNVATDIVSGRGLYRGDFVPSRPELQAEFERKKHEFSDNQLKSAIANSFMRPQEDTDNNEDDDVNKPRAKKRTKTLRENWEFGLHIECILRRSSLFKLLATESLAPIADFAGGSLIQARKTLSLFFWVLFFVCFGCRSTSLAC